MIFEDITPEDVIKAARKIYLRKGWFTAKDIWFELGHNRFGKNQKTGSRNISNILRMTEFQNKIRRCASVSTLGARYVFCKEEKNERQ